MAQNYLWGSLQRATNDSTVIDEAIAEGVQSHNDDPDAHLSAGQALTTHRAAEIIDHLAESVVNDKLRRTARRYVAIVDPSSDVDFDTLGAALVYAKSIGGGDIFITPGKHYIDSDLVISPNLGLYGVGSGETVISSNNTTPRALRFLAPGVNPVFPFYECEGITSSYDISYTLVEDYVADYMVGSYFGQGTEVPSILRVTEIDTTAQIITVATYPTANFSVDPGIVSTYAQCTDESNGIEFYGNSDLLSFSCYVGVQITLGDSSTVYTLNTLLEDGTWLLDKPFDGTSGFKTVTFNGSYGGTINIESLSLGDDTTDVFIAGDVSNAILEARDVAIFSKESTIDITGVCHFYACIFTLTSTGDYIRIDSGSFRDCIFLGASTNSKILTLTHDVTVDNCTFNRLGSGTLLPLYCPAYGGTVKGCTFNYVNSITVGYVYSGTGFGGVIFADNRVYLNSSQTLTFTGKNNLVNNNYIVRGTSGGLVFGASSTNNVCVGNAVPGTITNSGTGNSIANNVASYI